MADETDNYNGRRPSFDRRGNVRGYRSRPGAPMADTTKNAPMSQDRRTSDDNWNNMFKPIIMGGQSQRASDAPFPLTPTGDIINAPTPGYTGAFDPSGAGAIPGIDPPGEGESRSFDFDSPKVAPSLSILAAGGPTHAQSWGGDSFSAPSPSTPVLNKSFKNRYGTGSVNFDKRLSGGYGWGSNSRVT